VLGSVARLLVALSIMACCDEAEGVLARVKTRGKEAAPKEQTRISGSVLPLAGGRTDPLLWHEVTGPRRDGVSPPLPYSGRSLLPRAPRGSLSSTIITSWLPSRMVPRRPGA
jgi:hypothetical protein